MSADKEVLRRGIDSRTIQWEHCSASDFRDEFSFLTPEVAQLYHGLILCIEDLNEEGIESFQNLVMTYDAEVDKGDEFFLQFFTDVTSISQEARDRLKKGLSLLASQD